MVRSCCNEGVVTQIGVFVIIKVFAGISVAVSLSMSLDHVRMYGQSA